MLRSTHSDVVRIETGGRWLFVDSAAGGYDGPIDSDFAYVMGLDGLCLWSSQWNGDISVTVEIHDGPPPPTTEEWEKSVDLIVNFPSAVASGFSVDWPREGLHEIPLPAQRVAIRVLANGWTFPPETWNPADSWLLQVWPAPEQQAADG